MKIERVRTVFFSPCHGVRNVVRAIAAGLPPHEEHDLTLPAARTAPLAFGGSDLVIIGFPAYSGLPSVAAGLFALLTAQGSPALLAAVYGNREFEETLIQMDELARSRGFRPLAGIAAVAHHSIALDLGVGRPDERDRDALSAFGREALRLAELPPGEIAPFKAPGFYPDRKPGLEDILRPQVDPALCLRCGHCATVCPVGAIDAADPLGTDAARCIACLACRKFCPVQARRFTNRRADEIVAYLHRVASVRKEPQFFQ